ncbi:RNA binding protein Nrd1 [Paecilomyces variotii No. 5]|uniref:RNA binding protein Nrd1 n=1 Tax=Byssochlamys spectabilis (strain No. 5 / NBRC 109023) TaxID=1356009 RepID=V5I5N2_BYSSN|nr:RNA binding protein Nrd1 [Paecilomyces variotii No. 5]
MSSAVAELDGYLQSMLALKPPGVSGSKINSITSLCTANVQSESVLIQKIYTHFKRAPGTHKLGVLYVVDSVTRQWVEAARKAGQPSGSAAPDGTFAAGVNRVTELLPVLMTDIINNAPEDQKEKIKKLVDIWERGYTFPAPMLASFKEKLNAPPSHNIESTTPEGSPAPGHIPFGAQQQQNGAASSTPAPDTSSILKALADMAKQSTPAPAAPSVPPQTNPLNVLSTQSAAAPPVTSSVDQASQQLNGQAAVNPYAGNLATPFAALSNVAQTQGLVSQSQTPNPLSAPQNPLAALLPQATAAPAAAPAIAPDALQQVQLLQLLAAQGIPQEQWATALQILSLSNSANTGMANMGAGQLPGYMQPPGQNVNAWGARTDVPSRDMDRERERDRDYMRSPPGGYRRRSRSPGWDRRRDVSPPRRRDSPVYGEYHGDSPGRRGGDPRDARRRGNDYRQRSPAGRRRRTPTPPRKDPTLPPPGPKFVEWDYSIGQGNIKVLSRTLFVGGVTSSEAHLRSLFNKYGVVQTCIVNVDKRHAFVKMINRQDAVSAREGMEQYKSGDMQLRTRWGVGFGPRDCSDYQTGISVIPIERLTEADRKWMLTAEYGGTGGRPIESGMVVEEPDIEIGAGVSSKAISRRMATDKGGQRGPQSSRSQHDRFGGRPRERGMDNHGHGGPPGPGGHPDRDPSNANVGVPPAVPGFGFSFPGVPMFPPGFMMGGAQGSSSPAQPPPPGQS